MTVVLVRWTPGFYESRVSLYSRKAEADDVAFPNAALLI
jgi:hypothetical protein